MKAIFSLTYSLFLLFQLQTLGKVSKYGKIRIVVYGSKEFVFYRLYSPALANQPDALKLKLPFLLLDNIFYKTLHAHVNRMITNFLFFPVTVLFSCFHSWSHAQQNIQNKFMQTKGIRWWSKNYTLVSAPSIGRFFLPFTIEVFSFFLFRQLCLHISDSLHFFTLFLTNSLKKCQRKSFKNEYSTFCNFRILYHQPILQVDYRCCLISLLVSHNNFCHYKNYFDVMWQM